MRAPGVGCSGHATTARRGFSPAPARTRRPPSRSPSAPPTTITCCSRPTPACCARATAGATGAAEPPTARAAPPSPPPLPGAAGHRPRPPAPPPSSATADGVEALGDDAGGATRLWAARGNRLLRSDDGAASWRPAGRPLPEANASVRGISATGDVVVLTTDRGIFRTSDGGERWVPLVDNLPAHLEAGPRRRDPLRPDRPVPGLGATADPLSRRRAADRAAQKL